MARYKLDEVAGDFYIQLGKNIAKVRKEMEMTQDGLAFLSGYARGTIANIESGRQHPTLYTICILTMCMETNMSDLIPPNHLIEQAYKKIWSKKFGKMAHRAIDMLKGTQE